jgi:hypothetical protein
MFGVILLSCLLPYNYLSGRYAENGLEAPT